jgi:hypothetical protein
MTPSTAHQRYRIAACSFDDHHDPGTSCAPLLFLVQPSAMKRILFFVLKSR